MTRTWSRDAKGLPQGTKTCPRCRRTLSVSAFGLIVQKSCALPRPRGHCRSCAKKAASSWRRENPEQAYAHKVRHAGKAPPAFELADKACWYCGGPAEVWDHKVPKSRGGSDDRRNFVPCCRADNLTKARRTPAEYRKHLRLVMPLHPFAKT